MPNYEAQRKCEYTPRFRRGMIVVVRGAVVDIIVYGIRISGVLLHRLSRPQ